MSYRTILVVHVHNCVVYGTLWYPGAVLRGGTVSHGTGRLRVIIFIARNGGVFPLSAMVVHSRFRTGHFLSADKCSFRTERHATPYASFGKVPVAHRGPIASDVRVPFLKGCVRKDQVFQRLILEDSLHHRRVFQRVFIQ